MKISASLKSTLNEHKVSVETKGKTKSLNIPIKSSGRGPSLYGGELLSFNLKCLNKLLNQLQMVAL